MNVKVIKSGSLETNTYIVSIGSNCLVIDPAFAFDEIDDYVATNNFKMLGILLTHGHFDHIDSSEALAKKYSCKIYININDVELLLNPINNGSSKFLKRDIIIKKEVRYSRTSFLFSEIFERLIF